MRGVNVVLKGTAEGTISDMNGNFSLEVLEIRITFSFFPTWDLLHVNYRLSKAIGWRWN